MIINETNTCLVNVSLISIFTITQVRKPVSTLNNSCIRATKCHRWILFEIFVVANLIFQTFLTIMSHFGGGI